MMSIGNDGNGMLRKPIAEPSVQLSPSVSVIPFIFLFRRTVLDDLLVFQPAVSSAENTGAISIDKLRLCSCSDIVMSTDLSFKALLFSQLYVALVNVTFRMDVWLVLSSFCLADVDVRKPELVFQAANIAKPVLFQVCQKSRLRVQSTRYEATRNLNACHFGQPLIWWHHFKNLGSQHGFQVRYPCYTYLGHSGHFHNFCSWSIMTAMPSACLERSCRRSSTWWITNWVQLVVSPPKKYVSQLKIIGSDGE